MADPGSKGRVLIVDDEPSLREVLSRHLARAGYECRTAAGVSDALALLAAGPFELVLIDVVMPGESGLTLLQLVRSQYPETAVLMVTAVLDTAVAIDAVRLGAYDYLTKPIYPERLAVQVERALRKRELAQLSRSSQTYLRSRLQGYLSPQLLSEAFLDPLLKDVQSQSLEATVLFCDIRGFSALSRGCDAIALIHRLNRFYFEPVTRIILANKGMVNKFLGDGIMAIFGAPMPYQGHAACAVAAGRRIIAEVHRAEGPGDGRFSIGIGVASGPVFAGAVGGAGHLDYTVMGDAVNVAAQLEKAAPPGEILVDPKVFEVLAPEASPVLTTLKGRAEAATVYRLYRSEP